MHYVDTDLQMMNRSRMCVCVCVCVWGGGVLMVESSKYGSILAVSNVPPEFTLLT